MTTNPFHIDNLDPIGKAAGSILKGGTGSGRHPEGAAQWQAEAQSLEDRPSPMRTHENSAGEGARSAIWSDKHSGEIRPVAEDLRAVAELHDAIAQKVGVMYELVLPNSDKPWDVDDVYCDEANKGGESHDKVAETAKALADKAEAGQTPTPEEMQGLRDQIKEAASDALHAHAVLSGDDYDVEKYDRSIDPEGEY